jgi:hypothetical protein
MAIGVSVSTGNLLDEVRNELLKVMRSDPSKDLGFQDILTTISAMQDKVKWAAHCTESLSVQLKDLLDRLRNKVLNSDNGDASTCAPTSGAVSGSSTPNPTSRPSTTTGGTSSSSRLNIFSDPVLTEFRPPEAPFPRTTTTTTRDFRAAPGHSGPDVFVPKPECPSQEHRDVLRSCAEKARLHREKCRQEHATKKLLLQGSFLPEVCGEKAHGYGVSSKPDCYHPSRGDKEIHHGGKFTNKGPHNLYHCTCRLVTDLREVASSRPVCSPVITCKQGFGEPLFPRVMKPNGLARTRSSLVVPPRSRSRSRSTRRCRLSGYENRPGPYTRSRSRGGRKSRVTEHKPCVRECGPLLGDHRPELVISKGSYRQSKRHLPDPVENVVSQDPGLAPGMEPIRPGPYTKIPCFQWVPRYGQRCRGCGAFCEWEHFAKTQLKNPDPTARRCRDCTRLAFPFMPLDDYSKLVLEDVGEHEGWMNRRRILACRKK